jgi:hypothetical protein
MRPNFRTRLLATPALFLTLLALPSPAFAQPGTWSALHQRALQAFEALHQRVPAAEADWQANQPGIHMLLGLDEPLPGKTQELQCQGFLRANEALLGVPAADLRALPVRTTRQRTVQRFQQMAQLGGVALPVLDGELTLTFDNANGHLLRVVNATMPVLNLVRGAIRREEAVAKASFAAAGATFARGSAAAAEEAVIPGANGARHVWIVHVPGPTLRDLLTIAVDARTGEATRMPNRVLD